MQIEKKKSKSLQQPLKQSSQYIDGSQWSKHESKQKTFWTSWPRTENLISTGTTTYVAHCTVLNERMHDPPNVLLAMQETECYSAIVTAPTQSIHRRILHACINSDSFFSSFHLATWWRHGFKTRRHMSDLNYFQLIFHSMRFDANHLNIRWRHFNIDRHSQPPISTIES